LLSFDLCSTLRTGKGKEEPALKLEVFRCPGKGNNIPDIGESRSELDEALQTQAKPGVNNGAVLPEIEIPPVIGRVEVSLLYPAQ